MRRLVIGTAGHIDHGKTSLLEALTGIDCDRWAEEKDRGITIDLGFAHLEEDDLQVSFVDVPGHERFLHNALAGLGGIRLLLLVVAADEGVKPQTREHLAICSLLDIPHGLVVMTKRDLVDEDLLELAQLEVEELLEPSPFAGAPVMAVSSTTGEGIADLRREIFSLANQVLDTEEDHRVEAPFRLPVDRAFQLRGLGAIITGTLISGAVSAGETVQVLPVEKTSKVRSLQVHGEERPQALAGERTALQLAGVELADLERGTQLTAAEGFAPSRSLCTRFTLLADAPEPLTTFVPIRFHLYSSEVVGKLRPLDGGVIEPGESALVEIRLAKPVVAVRGDRFIVRRPSPASTLGGGVVLDSRWRRRRGGSLKAALEALAKSAIPWQLWVAESRERGATAGELATRVGQRAKEVAALLDEEVKAGKLLRVESGAGPRWIAPRIVEGVTKRARRALKNYLQQDRLASGMPKAQFLSQILPRRAMDLADVYLRWLEAQKVLVWSGGQVNLPGRKAELSSEESALSKALLEEVEAAGLTPPSPNEMKVSRLAKRQILEGVQRFLVEQGKLIRLPSGLILSAMAVEQLQQDLLESGWEKFSVADFKERFNLSRKWAIPLLEHLDSKGFTRRVGNQRQIIKP